MWEKCIEGKIDTSSFRLLGMLEDAKAMNANLLLNIGPMADGSIPEEDIVILTEVGKRLELNR